MPTSGLHYSTSEVWSDIDPLPQDDGGPNALATIAYTEEYKEAMSYLRAVMAANEFSPRVLELTAHIISMNPAHYTVWLYRAKCLSAISSPLPAEITYLNAVSLRYIKNYQIWHHRQHLITLLNSPDGETDFLAQMLDKDAKNYHVWSYRQWLVKHFSLWDDEGEIAEVERMLRRDVRNNSAWNHRWFVVFGREGEGQAGRGDQDTKVPEPTWLRELEFAKDAIRLSPQNESPWNYLRGLMRKRARPLSSLISFAEEFAHVDADSVPAVQGAGSDAAEGNQRPIRSSHALDFLADAYTEDESRWADARRALDMLADRYDPIRANYWNWRKGFVGGPGEAATAAPMAA